MGRKSFSAYLRAVYELGEKGRDTTTKNIASATGVSQASASEMVGKLAAAGLVAHEIYGSTRFTGRGRKEAIKAVRRYRLLKDFLVRILGVRSTEVDRQAEAMEHALSRSTDIELCRFLGRPEAEPVERRPIPHCEQKIECRDCLRKH